MWRFRARNPANFSHSWRRHEHRLVYDLNGPEHAMAMSQSAKWGACRLVKKVVPWQYDMVPCLMIEKRRPMEVP